MPTVMRQEVGGNMSSYNIALNFEDGVTRFVECKAGEKVLDAAFRAKINLPMD